MHRSDMGPEYAAVVGLDLSLTATGFVCSDGSPTPVVKTIRSKGKEDDSLLDRSIRLDNLAETIIGSMPDGIAEALVAVGIETPSYGNTTGHHHDRSGLWWLVVSRLLARGYNVFEVTPNQLKKYATGRGNASKMEVVAAAIKRYPEFDISNDNEADATVLVAFLSRALRMPIEIILPKVNLSALDKFNGGMR